MIENYWSPSRTLELYRDSSNLLGIRLIIGKININTPTGVNVSTLGVFIKSIAPYNLKGDATYQPGDRVLKIGSVDLQEANKEAIVDAIQKENEPVLLTVQSLMLLKDKPEKLVTSVPTEPKLTTSVPTEPKLATSVPTEPKLATSVPTEPKLTTSVLTEPKLTTSVPTEPKLATSVPTEPKLTTTVPTEPKLATSVPTEPKLVTSVPTEPKLATSVPTEPKLATSVPTELKSTDNKLVKDESYMNEINTAKSTNVASTLSTTKADYVSPEELQVGEREEKDDESKSSEEDDSDDDSDYGEIDYKCSADEIQKKYAKFGKTVMMVQLERGQKGLGLSLAGHKDRNCMAVFVCGLNPNGEAFKMGGIEVGDEILEVNGIVLHGRCHLNASAIIKGLAGPIFKIVILRRKAAINDIAVRPLTQFPVTLEEEVNEEKFSGYPNVRNVVMTKGNHSLGIMIIEGKHSELGQGIFISDILDDSVADKAGLEVGEMILAVNKDLLLGANYETAANILKRAEGVVTLVLSNPIKKLVPNEEEFKIDVTTGIRVPTPRDGTPRATTPIPDSGRPPSSAAEVVAVEVVDPTTCPIVPGKETTIEVKTNNQALGLFLVGGKDTLISNKIIVLEIFPGGAADKDGRVQAGDQIVEVNGTCLKDATNETALQTLRQILPKIKLVILRPKSAEYVTIEADLARKPGKGLGLSIIGKACGKGAYVSEILNGGIADIDGKMTKGDVLLSINGQDVENLSAEEIGTILKTISGRTVLKLRRYKHV